MESLDNPVHASGRWFIDAVTWDSTYFVPVCDDDGAVLSVGDSSGVDR